MEAFKEWWAQASSRDQISLVVCAGFVALYILYFTALKPAQEMYRSEQQKNVTMLAALERVRDLAAQVVALEGSGEDSGQRDSIEKVVQQTVSTYSLQVSSMGASGREGVRLRFDNASFEKVLQWLYDIELTHGLQIKDLNVSAASNQGAVNVNLLLHPQ